MTATWMEGTPLGDQDAPVGIEQGDGGDEDDGNPVRSGSRH